MNLFCLLDRNAQIALIFAALVAQGCGGGGGGSDPQRELADIGFGDADTYQNSPLEQIEARVDAVASAGMRFYVSEDRPTVQAKDWRKGEIPDRFPAASRAINERACANGQIHVVLFYNRNVEPIFRMTDEWASRDIDAGLALYDPACTWIEPVVEPESGDAKARRWTKMVADRWPGVIILPWAARGWTEVRRDYLDRHPQSVHEAEVFIASGDPNLLVITDGGPFVHPPTVLGDYPALVSLSLATGVPFLAYTDRYPGPHGPVIAALARGIRAGSGEALPH